MGLRLLSFIQLDTWEGLIWIHSALRDRQARLGLAPFPHAWTIENLDNLSERPCVSQKEYIFLVVPSIPLFSNRERISSES